MASLPVVPLTVTAAVAAPVGTVAAGAVNAKEVLDPRGEVAVGRVVCVFLGGQGETGEVAALLRRHRVSGRVGRGKELCHGGGAACCSSSRDDGKNGTRGGRRSVGFLGRQSERRTGRGATGGEKPGGKGQLLSRQADDGGGERAPAPGTGAVGAWGVLATGGYLVQRGSPPGYRGEAEAAIMDQEREDMGGRAEGERDGEREGEREET